MSPQDIVTSAAGLAVLPPSRIVQDAAETVAEDLLSAITGSIEHANVQAQPHLSWPNNPPATVHNATSGDIEQAKIKSTSHASWPYNGGDDTAEAYNQESVSVEAAKVAQSNSGQSMLNDFVSNISFALGFANQNRYQVFIPTSVLGANSSTIFSLIQANSETNGISLDWINSFYGGDLNQTAIELTAFCDKASLPGYQFQLETVRHYGPSFKIPHMPEYQDITLRFMCSSFMWERYFFDAWMYMVMDPVTNNFNYKSEYAVDMVITSFTNSSTMTSSTDLGDPNYTSRLLDAFPISITEQSLGYDINNSIQTIEVTFSYKFALPFPSSNKSSTTGMGLRGQPGRFHSTITAT